MNAGADRWQDAMLAAALLTIDPAGLGGASLRGGGMARDRWLDALRSGLPPGCPWRRVPFAAGDDALLGGLDLAATLSARRPVLRSGVLAAADGGIVLLAMADRADATTAARIASALDDGTIVLQRDGFSLVHSARLGLVALWIVLLAMADRADATTAARIASALDDGTIVLQRDGFSLVHSARLGLVAL